MKRTNLKGKKVFLRYSETSDFEEFTELNKSSRAVYKGLVSPPLDRKTFDAFLTRNESEANESFFFCLNSNEAIAGAINLSQIFRYGFQNAYLGYYVGSRFAGLGLTTEAIGLMLVHAFKNLKLHRIEANVQPENLASVAVLKKNGFTKEGFSPKYLKISGRWRDHERWAITRENWKPGK